MEGDKSLLAFSNRNRANPSHVILGTLQLGTLVFPELLLLLLGQVAEELQEVRQELAFIWVIKIRGRFAFVALLRIVDWQSLVCN